MNIIYYWYLIDLDLFQIIDNFLVIMTNILFWSICILLIYYVDYIILMTSSETLRCKECGIIFNTIEDLYEHQKSEEEDKILRHKGFSDG